MLWVVFSVGGAAPSAVSNKLPIRLWYDRFWMSSRITQPADEPRTPPQTATSNPADSPEDHNKSLENSELRKTPLQTGTAARRLQAQDDSRHMFQYGQAHRGLLGRLRRYGWPTLRYLTQTEVHTYAFSVAANAILSLCPLIVLLLTIIRRVFHSPQMYNVVLQLLHDYLPSNQDFVIRNLQFLASVQGRGQALSLVVLLITSTGIFLPLEVALNSVWGFKKNRSYLMNALASFGLAVLCGGVALLSVAAVAKGLHLLGLVMGSQNLVFNSVTYFVVKCSSSVTNIAIYFLIYWLLPHGRVPIRAVLPAAVITGLVTEAAK